MIDGAQASRRIGREVTKAEGEATKSANALTDLHNEEASIRVEMGSLAKRLAEIHIGDIAAGRLDVGKLKAFERVAINLKRREEQLHRLNEQLEFRVEKRKPLRVGLANAASARAAAEQKQAEAYAALDFAKSSDPELADISQKHALAEGSRRALASRFEEAQTDLIEKRQAYHRDLMFTYLLGRRYGTPDYRARGLAKHMDGLVADYCGFESAYSKYQLLNQLPEFVNRHLAEAMARCDELRSQAEARTGILATAHVPVRVESDLNIAIADEREAEGHLNTLQREINRLGTEIKSFSTYTDPTALEMNADLKCFYDEALIGQLEQIASATPNTEDDEIVSRLRRLRDRRLVLMKREADLQSAAQASEARAKRLDRLHRDFKRDAKATPAYEYNESTIDGFITGLLVGDIVSSSAVHGIFESAREIVREVPAPTSIPPPSGFSSSEHSHSPSGLNVIDFQDSGSGYNVIDFEV